MGMVCEQALKARLEIRFGVALCRAYQSHTYHSSKRFHVCLSVLETHLENLFCGDGFLAWRCTARKGVGRANRSIYTYHKTSLFYEKSAASHRPNCGSQASFRRPSRARKTHRSNAGYFT